MFPIFISPTANHFSFRLLLGSPDHRIDTGPIVPVQLLVRIIVAQFLFCSVGFLQVDGVDPIVVGRFCLELGFRVLEGLAQIERTKPNGLAMVFLVAIASHFV